MVKVTSIDIPLSEMILNNKKNNKKKSAKKPIRKVGGGIAKRRSAGTPRRQSGGGRDQGRGRVIRKSSGAPDKRSVRINISNLADTVMSSDLEQLFEEYDLRKVSVNYGEDGKPSGTGDIVLPKHHADRLLHKFAGVALDNRVMHFAVIEASSTAGRVSGVGGTSNRRQSGGHSDRRPTQKKPALKSPRNKKSTAGASRPPGKSTKKPKREPKPQKTAEELDAELDAYMARS